MKNRFSCIGRPVWAVVIVVMLALLVSLSTCHHRRAYTPEEKSRYSQLDSLLGAVTDLDSLAEAVTRAHEQNDLVAEIIALKYQGKALRKLSRCWEAINVHTSGYELAESACDTLEMIAALANIATDYRRMGDLSTANGYYFKGLALSDAYSDKESRESIKRRVITLNGIGNIEIELCHYAAADSVFHEALNGEIALESYEGMAINYANLGAVKRALGDRDSAWYNYRESLKYNQLQGDDGGIALCHYYFGQLYMDERNFSRAEVEFKQSYEQLKQFGETWHWLEPCLGLASVNLLMGEKEEVRRYLLEAEAEAQRVNSKEHLAKAYELHYELSLLEGDSQEALQYFISSDQLYDSIYGLEKSDEMRRQRIDYHNSRSSGEVDVLKKDINRLKRLRIIHLLLLILLLLMAALVIGALVYAIRLRARTQRLMRQVEETRSLFFTNVVHQLRSPLSAIMGAIDNLFVEARANPEAYTETQRQDAEVIQRQGNNLLTLMDRILEVGSVRSALTDPEWLTGDAVSYVRMIVESYRELCVDRHIELTYAPRETNIEIDSVPRYLNTIVGSLLENAINYCNDYGKIIVTTCVNGDMFTLRVADNGMGISQADLPHVFEPFYRASSAEQIIDGIGIGLTVVRDMAMAMGGTVSAESEKGQGAVFTVNLPCKRGGVRARFEQVVAPVRDLAHRRQHTTEQQCGQNDTQGDLPVVLVVEDHNDVAMMICKALGKGYRVHFATDGEQGLAKAIDLQPDLIITDVKMPVMDGMEMCRHLRLSSQLCHVPVIMLSARTSPEDRIRGIEAGADAYLVKPFVRDELRVLVTHLLDRCRPLRTCATDVNPGTVDALKASPVDSTSDEKFLTDFAAEVDKQLGSGNKLDFDKIAHKFRMGESQLRRRIQVLTGKNMSAYITQLRMEKALRLLQECPDLLIGDVAERCGFLDVAYFSRVFRQQYGKTPTQARNER